MGDRTYHQVYIWACPPEQVGTVVDLLKEHGYVSASAPDDVDTDRQLILGDCYHIEEAYLGTTGELFGALVEQAPGVHATGWEDPKYEYMGEYFAYQPELGLFSAPCGSGGEPLFTAEDVVKIIAENYSPADLAKVLGTAWDDVSDIDDQAKVLTRVED